MTDDAGVIEVVVYVSAAARPFLPEELGTLLAQARRNNLRDGITGMLLHHDGSFMQAVEGPPPAIDALMARLRTDTRHRAVIELLRERQAGRDFANWSMACFHGGDLPPGDRDQVVDFFGEAYRPERRDAAAGRARMLLNGFRDSLTRQG